MQIPTTPQVVACIDGSKLTEAVCDYAAWISQKTQAPLTLLHTINHHHEAALKTDASGTIGLGTQEQLRDEITELEEHHNRLKLQEGKLLLQQAQKRVEQDGIDKPLSTQRHGDLVEVVIEIEDRIRVLVLGMRGQVHQDKPNQIGAKLEAVIRSLHKPILIVNQPFKQPKRIMLAYDGSKAAEKAVDMVAASPLYQDLICHLVCVNKDESLLARAAEKLKSAQCAELIPVHLTGDKTEQVLCEYQQQQNIDMIVMGAFSHSRLHDMLLGSFTHKMLINAQKPLLLLR
jgi:nucleotide-binding universal stress UspA family protein